MRGLTVKLSPFSSTPAEVRYFTLLRLSSSEEAVTSTETSTVFRSAMRNSHRSARQVVSAFLASWFSSSAEALKSNCFSV